MAFQPITTALSRALALRLDPGTIHLGGGLSGLNLTVSPAAQASNRVVLPASQPVGSVATALGLGLGSSRFLADPANADFFNSPGLSIVTGGGSIGGTAAATASTTGRNDNTADARAVNIGLANLDVVTRGATGDLLGVGPLHIGTLLNPFTATASVATRSLQAPQSTPLNTAQLSALATVRGLEGAPPAGPAPWQAVAAAPLTLGGILPSFYGQPNAAVLAAASLDADPGPTTTTSRAVADAKGIEGYRVMALTPAGGGTAQVSGLAAATLTLNGAPPTPAQPADLTASAIGIDHSALRGPGSGSVEFQGSGLALLDAAPPQSPPPPAGSLKLNSLQGIGILASDIQTNGSNATVIGTGGFAAPKAGGLLSGMDAAGIDNSRIYSGSGTLTVEGRILTEQDAKVDANGDGVLSPTTFLDASALTGGQGGFDGIRNSTILTAGSGNAQVYGSSNNSRIDLSNGSINLDRAKGSTLAVNSGDGVKTGSITVGLALDNSLKGGFGSNRVQVGAGSGNQLDGGFGQDLVIGPTSGSGSNTFRQSNAGAALDAATPSATPLPGSSFAERLTDPGFWASLSASDKQTLWTTGSLQQGGQTFREDTFSNLRTGSGGDVLEVSSSLGSLTQGLWESQGALFGVQGGQLVVRDGPANSQLGLVVGTLADIRSLGIGAPSLAYATDTRQLMFDADGDWKDGGSRSLGTVTMSDPAALTKANIHFGSGA
ncbi:MAG: hypothetical protein ER33_04620 [Cyanobium sp. CACIAM 14]|nr:MAG: hypothetical protein ER33_04620 [Cyanobium sp. CACIAM 14]